MEVTPEAHEGIKKLIAAGWTITNQHVLTTASSRRGHIAQLRKVLNEIGVLSYYTLTVKGYMENHHNFATNARAVQEQVEEKVIGQVPEKYYEKIRRFPEMAESMVENIQELLKKADILFLSTDRNILNLPGVGKSR
jgi:lysine 2,3-aminomutase